MTLSARVLEHRLSGAEKALSDECANSLRLAQENTRLRELLALARGGLYIDLRDEIDAALEPCPACGYTGTYAGHICEETER